MADRYLSILQFLIPHFDLPTVTWFFYFASHSLPMSKRKTKNKPRPPPNPNLPKRTPSPDPQAFTNSPPPSTTAMTDSLPKGGRKGNRPDEEHSIFGNKGGGIATQPSSGLTIPGETLGDTEGKESLKIKIHLNLHAKVRLDLDAQLYGDIVIGLL
ncbi:uncharacterized protein N7498_002673 [Penicillium cinerascens]|uniref:Uncharacterized protein n=1 Tax=Penicillium cinerascens TaxID=70096 RepID=A0A9W9NAH1_9EURO|nr:uncharacterized protein N7498_002673 [Penicillium cinerascens]KAJ5216266.1 hypothetical protein N7498_002673 [Penicillium cinerascens]